MNLNLNLNLQAIGLMDPRDTTCLLPTVEDGKGTKTVIFKCRLTAQALCDRRVSIRYLLADPSRDPSFPLRVRVQQETMSQDKSPHEDMSPHEREREIERERALLGTIQNGGSRAAPPHQDVSHHEAAQQARYEVYSVGYSVENAFRGSSSTFDGKDGGEGGGGGSGLSDVAILLDLARPVGVVSATPRGGVAAEKGRVLWRLGRVGLDELASEVPTEGGGGGGGGFLPSVGTLQAAIKVPEEKAQEKLEDLPRPRIHLQICGTGRTASGVFVQQFVSGGKGTAGRPTDNEMRPAESDRDVRIHVRARYSFESGNAVVFC